MRVLLTALLLLTGQQPVTRSVEIWSSDPIALVVEMVTIDAVGRETVTATRRTAVGPPVPLEFLHGPDRYVRMSYQGASPRTFSTAELLARKKVHVPDVLPGGELLLLFPPATVRPVRVLLHGPRTQAKEIAAEPHVSFAGLPPGDYTITPIYKGDVEGVKRLERVRAAATVIHPMPIERVGAVRITAIHPDVCALSTELVAVRSVKNTLIDKDGIKHTIVEPRRAEARLKQPACVEEIGGLPPDSYIVEYQSALSKLGVATGVTEPQRLTEITIDSAPIRVSGRATFNGRPLPIVGLRLQLRTDFLSGGYNVALASGTVTDEQGYFSLSVDKPGDYTITASNNTTGVSKRVRLVEGQQTLDLSFTGAEIHAAIEGWQKPQSVRLVATQGNRVNIVTWDPAREPDGPRIIGLAYGNYEVAVEVDGRAYPGLLRNVTISEATPEARLTFDLRKR